MDSRIRLFTLADELIEMGAGFIPRKDMICIATGLPAASHEIAHMVEMTNPKRWTIQDWGMKLHVDSFSARGFFAALSRETRVRAIQRHMDPTIPVGAPLNNPFCWVRRDVLPFGRFKTYEDVIAWVKDLHEKTYAAWSLDRIRHEWEIRINYIRHWMETKEAA